MDLDDMSRLYPRVLHYAAAIGNDVDKGLDLWQKVPSIERTPHAAEQIERRVAQACLERGIRYRVRTDFELRRDKTSGGYYNPHAREIVVRDTQPLPHIAEAAVHEFTHAMDGVGPLSYFDRVSGYQHFIECYTELTAHVVCQHYGLDTSERTALYLVGTRMHHDIPWERITERATDLIPKVLDRLEHVRGNYVHPNRVTR